MLNPEFLHLLRATLYLLYYFSSHNTRTSVATVRAGLDADMADASIPTFFDDRHGQNSLRVRRPSG